MYLEFCSAVTSWQKLLLAPFFFFFYSVRVGESCLFLWRSSIQMFSCLPPCSQSEKILRFVFKSEAAQPELTPSTRTSGISWMIYWKSWLFQLFVVTLSGPAGMILLWIPGLHVWVASQLGTNTKQKNKKKSFSNVLGGKKQWEALIFLSACEWKHSGQSCPGGFYLHSEGIISTLRPVSGATEENPPEWFPYAAENCTPAFHSFFLNLHINEPPSQL